MIKKLLPLLLALTLCACGAKPADVAAVTDDAAPVEPVGNVVNVQWADEVDLSLFEACDEFSASSDSDAVWVVFIAQSAVKDFKVLSIEFLSADDSGKTVFATQELYAQDALTPERPLAVRVSFPGDIPSNGVSFVDETGETVFYAVSESGMDGSLVMSAFEASPD